MENVPKNPGSSAMSHLFIGHSANNNKNNDDNTQRTSDVQQR